MESAITRESFHYSEDLKSIRMKMKTLQATGKLFTDKDFPTDMMLEGSKNTKIVWQRIKESDEKPALFLNESPTSGYMEAGIAGDTVLLSIFTAIANHPKLLHYVFPPGQDFNSHEYCGLFYFRFWKMGRWVYVMVDDKLPVIRGKDDKKKQKEAHKNTSAEEEPKGSTEKQDDNLSTKDEFSMAGSKESINSKNHSKVAREDKLKNRQGADPNKNHLETMETKMLKKDHIAREDKALGNLNTPGSKGNIERFRRFQHNNQDTSGNQQASNQTSKGVKDDGSNESKEVKSIFVNVIGSNGMKCYWAALLEKAYAKFCGGYHQIARIGLTEKLMAITGGVIELFYANLLPDNFFLELKCLSDHNCVIMSASTLGMIQQIESSRPTFHTITQVEFVDLSMGSGHDKMLGFVKLKNPFGKPNWEGGWKDVCNDWKNLPDTLKDKYKMSTNEIGEFYLTYNNFIRAFSTTVVAIVADGTNYNCEGYLGFWKQPDLKYALCDTDEMRFHDYTQIKISIRDPNSDDELPVEVVISLVQDGRCCCSESSINSGIKFYIFCLEDDQKYSSPLGFEFFRYNRPLGCSNYSDQKHVTGRFHLVRGHYLVVLVPDVLKVYHPCLANDYLLRVITPAKFPKPPPPHMMETFCNSDNLNIYYDYAEIIEDKTIATDASSTKSEAGKEPRKEKGKGKKKNKH